MIHWLEPAEMHRSASSDAWETCLEVPAGAYDYKFSVADGEWELDAHNARTRSWLGARNSLLVVEGAEEPLLHAPALPWVFVGDDGRVCVRAGVRKGAAEDLSLMVDDGSGWATLRMRPAASEDEHELFEAWFPVRSESIDYLFALPDGSIAGASGGPGLAFHVELGEVRRSCPNWWREAVVYTVFVDRFRRGGTNGTWDLGSSAAGGRGFAGGDLDGIVEDLPRLAELGISVLHLTPIATAASSHRYDVIDPQQIDPSLGGEEAFRRLIDAVHERGLKLIADVPLTQVHRDFFAFRDVREKGPASQYWDWFRILRYPSGIVPGPDYQHYQKGRWEEPLLNLENPELQDYLARTIELWAARGVDGLRLDSAADLPLPLVRRLVRTATSINPQAIVFGEVTVDNGYRWLGAGLHSATDFGVQHVLHELLWKRSISASEAARRLARMRFLRGGQGWSSLAFSATHDQPRLMTLLGDRRRNQLGQLIVLMGASIPAIYYGDELGLRSGEPGRSCRDAWPDRMTMPWSHLHGDEGLSEWFRRALALRRSCLALRHGDEVFLAPENAGDDVLIVRRMHPAERVDVILHAGEGEVRFPAPPCPRSLMLEVGDVRAEGGEFVIGPWSGAVVGCVR